MGMDKARRSARTTMGQRAGAPCTSRLRWENQGQKEFEYVPVSTWRVNPPQRSCSEDRAKIPAWPRSLFLASGGYRAIAPCAAVVRALSLHGNCLQITSLPPQTFSPCSCLLATLKRTLTDCLNTVPTPTISSHSSSTPTSSARPAGTTSSSR